MTEPKKDAAGEGPFALIYQPEGRLTDALGRPQMRPCLWPLERYIPEGWKDAKFPPTYLVPPAEPRPEFETERDPIADTLTQEAKLKDMAFKVFDQLQRGLAAGDWMVIREAAEAMRELYDAMPGEE